jgi:flagellar basal-body rod modification protein FlgD
VQRRGSAAKTSKGRAPRKPSEDRTRECAITAPTPVSGNVADYLPKTSAPTKTNSSDAAAKPGGELGKDAFLKLLVAQLKYQDPSNPMDNTEFLAQTAQFTTVEKLTDLATAEQNLLNAQLQLGASNLIGRTVSYTDQDGKVQSGVVTSAKFFTGGPPTLHVGNTDIALASVTEVAQASAPTGPGQGPNPPVPAQAAPTQPVQPAS